MFAKTTISFNSKSAIVPALSRFYGGRKVIPKSNGIDNYSATRRPNTHTKCAILVVNCINNQLTSVGINFTAILAQQRDDDEREPRNHTTAY